MPLSRPDNPPIVNESVATSMSSGFSIDESQTKINQLHGIAANNTIGAGIPKQVSNAQVSIANASTGSTCTASILFKADPTDTSLSGINVWVKGYQGNSNPVLVGSGTSSPTKIVLNNTGEIVTFTIQAFGNGGNAPFSQSPTCSGTLPKSTAGGFGPSTVTSAPSVSGTATPGQLAKFATPATTVTGADLTGDVTTSGSVATTVKKIEGVAVSATAPFDQQVLKFFSSQNSWIPEFVSGPWFSIQASGVTTSWVMQGMYAGVSLFNTGGTNAAATSSLPPGITFTTSSGAGTSAGWNSGSGASVGGAPIQFWREVQWTAALSQTTLCRIWMGMGDNTLVNDPTTLRNNTPTMNFVGFRYSTAASDTKYQCCTFAGATSSITSESTASHVDTSSHKFAIRWDGANVIFLIDNVQVGSQSTNVPTQALFPIFYIDNAAAANAKGFTFYNVFGVGKTY